jgi:oxygen-independent coproporphyrinogen-3 oxidase
MKLIREADLPPADDLPVMFVDAVQRLTDAGYLWIGLDHFCLPSDSLSKKVGRTFNGFSSGTTEMIGVGPTTTGVFGDVYCQATYDLNDYYKAINQGEFPILRGYRMSADDLKRREVIFSLLCRQWADVTDFPAEQKILENMPELCRIYKRNLILKTYGRVLMRNICKVFDNKDVKPEHHKIAQLSMTRKVA